MAKKSFKENDIFHEKDIRFSPPNIRKSHFLIWQVPIKKYGLKTLFLLFIDFFFYWSAFTPVTKLNLLHIVVALHYTHHIKMAWFVRGGGGEAVKMLKKNLL